MPHVGGPIITGCPLVLIGGLAAARATDVATCTGPADMVAVGSATVFIGGLPAARAGDLTAHGGTIVLGNPTVLIGDVPKVSLQAKTLMVASQAGAPFCEECQERKEEQTA